MGSKLRGLRRLVKDKIKHVKDTANSSKKIATTAIDALSQNSLEKTWHLPGCVTAIIDK